MYADRALVLPWVSGSMSRDKIGGFVVQGILRFTNLQYYLFPDILSGSRFFCRPYKDNVFIDFAIRTAWFISHGKSILCARIIKIHIVSKQFKRLSWALSSGD